MLVLKLAGRRLLRRPAFTLPALATLAVALGAVVAIFALVDGVLLRPLSYPQAERLVDVGHSAPGLGLPRLDISDKLYLYYRNHVTSFEEVGLYQKSPVAVSGLDRPLQVPGASVSPSTLRLVGAKPIAGRLFTEDEGMPGTEGTLLISEDFWKQRLGRDPRVLERSLEIDGSSRRIVGVLANGLDFPDADVEIWTPYAVDASTAALGAFGRSAVARLAPGSSLERATAEIRSLTGSLTSVFPDEGAARVLQESGFDVRLSPLRDAVVGDVGPILWILAATVGFVLLLATVNVTNLFVARAETRRREAAIRSALGQGRRQAVMSALAEGGILAMAAAVLAVFLGRFALDLLLRRAPMELPRVQEVAVDGRSVAAVFLLAVAIGMVFGLVPLLRRGSVGLVEQLKDGGRLGRGRHRVRRLLVIAQMAVAVVLLVGAGLTARSYGEIVQVEPGFVAEDGLTFRLSLPESRVEGNADAARFYDLLLERLASLPGVRAVATADALPLSGLFSGSGHRTREAAKRGDAAMPTVYSYHHVSAGYFSTLGIPMVEGRPLERRDFLEQTGAVVVSAKVAREQWPGESAVGKFIFPGSPGEDQRWMEVVGVAEDVRAINLTDSDQRGIVYYPWLSPGLDTWQPVRQSVVLRSDLDPETLMAGVREVVWSLDPTLPISGVETLEAMVDRARARTAFTALMMLVAAAVAVLLGAVGTYGVISYLVTQRTGEIGVRVALGAGRRDVAGLVLKESLRLAAAGGAVGLVAAALLSRGLDALLVGVEPHDPVTFLAVALLLPTVAGLAAVLPARRAARVQTSEALRAD